MIVNLYKMYVLSPRFRELFGTLSKRSFEYCSLLRKEETEELTLDEEARKKALDKAIRRAKQQLITFVEGE